MKAQFVMSALIAGVQRVSRGTYMVGGESITHLEEMMKAANDAACLREAAERRARRAAKRVRDRDAAERGRKR